MWLSCRLILRRSPSTFGYQLRYRHVPHPEEKLTKKAQSSQSSDFLKPTAVQTIVNALNNFTKAGDWKRGLKTYEDIPMQLKGHPMIDSALIRLCCKCFHSNTQLVFI
jgi:hypothetical protein